MVKVMFNTKFCFNQDFIIPSKSFFANRVAVKQKKYSSFELYLSFITHALDQRSFRLFIDGIKKYIEL